MDKKQVKESLVKMGWNLSPETECWEDEGYFFFEVQPESQYGYTVQVDPETGKSRHCGNGRGCFWTEWEQEGEQ